MIPRELIKFGAVEVSEGEGYIPLRNNPISEPYVLSVVVSDTKNYVVYPLSGPIRSIIRRLIWLLLPKKECKMTVPPNIIYSLAPLKVTNVAFHWGGLYFTGDIVNKLQNNSQPGKIGICEVLFTESCPQDPGEYSWKEDEDSANITGNWVQNAWEDSTGVQFIRNLNQELQQYLTPNNWVTITGKWKTDSLVDTWEQFLNILLTGTITTTHGFDVTIKYKFDGKMYTSQKHINIRVRLPVVGNINWFSW